MELVPHGSSTPVTKQNLLSYIYLYANFKLNIETGKQCRAFLSGFRDLIPVRWIRIFSAQEIQMVIGGDGEKPLDLVALQAHCTYSGGYHPSQPYIQVHLLVSPPLTSTGILENHRIIPSRDPTRLLAVCDELLSTANLRIWTAVPTLQHHENSHFRW